MNDLTQLRRLGLFDARVPRYTSYPTAPHFKPSTGVAQTAAWLQAIRPGETISLYLHVPFCRRLCWFCACRTQGTPTRAPLARYLDALHAEIDLVAAHLPAGVQIGHLHWGGGTPTLLSPAEIIALAGHINLRLPLADQAQFSVEIDPGEIDEARLAALRAAGMNRASIGIQDFDPRIQATIGRLQDYEVTRRAVEQIRAQGITSLNMDILFGLPHQTETSIAQSVQQVLSLSPDRVALYGYAHVPWMAKRQNLIPTDTLPTPEERLALFETARELFLWDGYAEIGIDHFARPGDGLTLAARQGRLHRNFQGYTEDGEETLIGIGASSISRYRQGYAQNDPSTSAYQQRVLAGQLATARGHVFAGDDRLRSRMIEALLCDFAIDFAQIAAQTGTQPGLVRDLAARAADRFEDMVQLTADRLLILPAGRPLARMIARHLDAYEMSAAGHSPAI